MNQETEQNQQVEYTPTDETPPPPSPHAEVISHLAHSKIVRRVLLPLYLVIMVVFLYKFMGWYSNRQTITQPKVEQTAQAPIPTAVTQPPANVQVTTTPNATVTVAAPPASISAPVAVTVSPEQAQQTEDELLDLKNTLSEHEKTLKEIKASIGKLNNSVNSVSHKVGKMLIKPKPIIIKKKIAAQAISYHVTAIIQGRAWLEDVNGNTITVRVGDTLNGGKVDFISPEKGVVALSNGEIIQYGTNDF